MSRFLLTFPVFVLAAASFSAQAQTLDSAASDLKAFHDEILSGGPLPLDVLDARVDCRLKASVAGDGRQLSLQPANPILLPAAAESAIELH